MSDKLDKIKNDFIEQSLTDFDKAMAKLEKQLFDFVIETFTSKVSVIDGRIEFTASNFKLSNELSTKFEAFTKDLSPAFREIARKMLEVVDFAANYFTSVMGKTVLPSQIKDSIKLLEQRIGIDSKGNIIAGSFIDRLSKVESVRSKILDTINNSISSNASLKDARAALREVIVGNVDVDGSLVKYAKQYVHDTFFQTTRVIDTAFSEKLKLKYFVYMGDIIDTTRDFCQARAGMVFHVDDVKSWPKNKPYFPDPYDFFVDQGGYNCRHWIKYISESKAKRMGYDTSRHKN